MPLTSEDVIRAVYPVTKIIVYGNGCYETVREATEKLRGPRPERGKIQMLSKKSLLRLMFLMQCTKIRFTTMLTLTYPKYYPRDGEIVKKDINFIAQKIRRYGWRYLWFLEFQKRGAPHVHVLLDNDAITPKLRADFGLSWTKRVVMSEWFGRICPPEEFDREIRKMSSFNCRQEVWEMIRNRDGARNYVTKYASKERQKTVPSEYQNVGRFWGASKGLRPEGVTLDVTEDELEEWLVDHGHPAKDYSLVPRYIWGITKDGTSVA